MLAESRKRDYPVTQVGREGAKLLYNLWSILKSSAISSKGMYALLQLLYSSAQADCDAPINPQEKLPGRWMLSVMWEILV